MSSMAKTFREWNPEQAVMFPPTVLDLVERDDLAHFVRNLVLEQLDLSEITKQYQEERGYPPFHPVMMTALLLYSYSQGIYSSSGWREPPTASGLHGTDGDAEARLSNDQPIPTTAPEGVGIVVPTSAATV